MMNTHKPVELVGGVLLNADHEIGLLHRFTPGFEQFEVPGGKIETDQDGYPSESPRDALSRELYEELGGCWITIVKWLARTSFSQRNQSFEQELFLVEVTRGQPKVNEPDKFDAFPYFSRRNLIKLERQDKLSPGAKAMLRILPKKFVNIKAA